MIARQRTGQCTDPQWDSVSPLNEHCHTKQHLPERAVSGTLQPGESVGNSLEGVFSNLDEPEVLAKVVTLAWCWCWTQSVEGPGSALEMFSDRRRPPQPPALTPQAQAPQTQARRRCWQRRRAW
jgi:hypothetical protein